MSVLTLILILFSVISGVAKVGFGFGAGILLNPILTLFVPSASAVSLLAPILWYSNLAGTKTHKDSIQWRVVTGILPSGIIGTLIGAWSLSVLNDEILKPGLGVVAILMGILLLFSKKVDFKERNLSSLKLQLLYIIVGGISGFIGATANSAGLPLIVFFLWVASSKISFTSNIVALLAIMDTVKLLCFLYLEMLTISNFLMLLLYVPFIFIGARLGKWLNDYISEKSFFVVVHSMIFITGVMLLVR